MAEKPTGGTPNRGGGYDFDGTRNEYGIALANKMQLILRQPTSDMTTFLTNEDYQGDFFNIGDVVKIAKPDPNSVNVVVGAKDCDRPELRELNFESTVMVIDKSMKYAFQICDIIEAEGRWNYESGALDLAAQNMRIKHNLETANLVVNSDKIPRIGTPANPIPVNGDTFYSKVLVGAYASLRAKGAITADGRYTFGSNPEEQKRTRAAIFMPEEGLGLTLTSKWVTNRPTADADDVLRTAGYKEVLGMSIEFEPSLSQKAADHITVENLAEGAFAVVIGTNNTVTRAGKVLKPDVMRDVNKYADNYYGLEIYGEKIASPNSCVVAFCTLDEHYEPISPVAPDADDDSDSDTDTDVDTDTDTDTDTDNL